MALINSILLYLTFKFVACAHIIFYSENDFDQTIPIYGEDKDVGSEILNFLGLPERPTQNWTEESIGHSAPNFLIKMYERFTDKGFFGERTPGIRKRRFIENDDRDKLISPLDELVLFESDNVMSFISNYIPLFDEPIFRNRLQNILWFNTSGIPSDISLMAAQLKLHKQKVKKKHEQYEIIVYTISVHGENEIGLNFVSSIQIMSNYEGWLDLNVTKPLNEWHKDAFTNKGFYLESNVINGVIKKEVQITSIGLPNMRTEDSLTPFMVGYFRNKEEVPSSKLNLSHVRNKRRPPQRKVEQPAKLEHSKIHKSCQKLSFTVDFKKLNWLSWIVAPEKFDSYFCSGDCSFPLNDIPTTNHAIIQTLAHLKNPHLPKPCCAPTALTSIAIIYHVSKDLVNMKKYNNMVVKSCGCL